MFGLIKKFTKPTHEKYGRLNYIDDLNNLKDDEKRWILLLSALFVEALDIDLGLKNAQHDQLCFYNNRDLSISNKREIIDEFLTAIDKDTLERKLETWATDSQINLLVSMNAENMDILEEWVKTRHGEEDDDEEDDKKDDEEYDEEEYEDALGLSKHIFKNKNRYEELFFHIAYLAEAMWQVRLSAVMEKITEEEAWDFLRKIASRIKVLIPVFGSWEEYHENIQLFHEVDEHEYGMPMIKNLKIATECFSKLDASPFHNTPIGLYADTDHPYTVTSYTNYYAQRISEDDEPTLIKLEQILKDENYPLLFQELHQLEGIKRDYHFAYFVSDVGSRIDTEECMEFPDMYPDEPYAYLFRAEYFYHEASEARGTSIASEVGEENYAIFYEKLQESLEDFFTVYNMMPEEKFVWARIYGILSLLGSEEMEEYRQKFYRLIETEGMTHFFCVESVSQFKEKRWGGSHQENIDWANLVVASTKKGDPCRLITYRVALERKDYIESFEEDTKKAMSIFKDDMLAIDLNQYYEELIDNIDYAPYRIHRTLLMWYLMSDDLDRVRELTHLFEAGKYSLYALDDYCDKTGDAVMHWARYI